MGELFVSAFITLFVVIDPPGCAPIFAGLTKGATAARTRAMAIKSCLVAGGTLVLFALIGERMLDALHIGLDAFRIAGGIMLFLTALEMVFERRTERTEEHAGKLLPAPPLQDISVFPMGTPMIAGPGAIASIMLLMSRGSGTAHTLVILGALGAVMALCLIALLAAPALMRLLGHSVEAVITRLLGVLLAALAAQYVIDGVKAVLAG